MKQAPFQPLPDPRPEIEEALEQAITRSTGNKRYPVSDGRLVYEEHRRYRYAYQLEKSWDLTDGTDLQLRSTDFDGLPVQLSNTKDDTITIVTTQRLPERTLVHAELVVDRAYLLRKLKEALDPLTSVPTTAQLGLKLFGHLDCPDVSSSSHSVELIADVFTPDEAQRLAIQRALRSELLMILGPPGTGKTDVLAAIALLHATLYQHRVLISSHTNIAIDNAIIRLVGFIKKHGLASWLHNQSVVRYGNPHLAELETDDYRNVTMPLIVADYVEQQRLEITRLEQRREQVIAHLAEDERELPRQRRVWKQRKKAIPHLRKKAEEALRTLEEKEQARLAPILEQLAFVQQQDQQVIVWMNQAYAAIRADEQRLAPLIESYQALRTEREHTRKKLELLRGYGVVKRLFVQLRTGEWERDLDATVQAIVSTMQLLAEQIRPLQQHQEQAKQAYQQAVTQHNELYARMASWTEMRDRRPEAYLQQQEALQQAIKDLDQEAQHGNQRIIQLEQAIARGAQERALIEDALARLDQQVIDVKREAARKVVEAAQVVGATLTSLSMNPVLLRQEWDVVIVDEGSMAPPPAVLIAANRARAHLIVVGDPLQLAPVCKFKEPQIKYWFGRDVFSHGGYTLEQAATATHHSVLLPYQGRMATAICDLIREPVYKGRLKDRSPRKPRPAIGPEPDSPVVLYDTSGVARARAEQPASKSSRFNRYHAEISIRLTQLALARMPTESRNALGL